MLPKTTHQASPPSYYGSAQVTPSGYINYSLAPYKNPYQSMGDAFGSLSATFADLAAREQFLANCLVANGWRQASSTDLALTVSAFALVGEKEIAYEGSATGYPDRTGTIKMISKAGNVCVGNFRYTSAYGGTGLVRCDDGDSANVSFTAVSNSSGYGSGKSGQGEVVRFVYGMEGEDRAKYLKVATVLGGS
jgi:hypothetical protein